MVEEDVSRLMEVRGDAGRKPTEETRPAEDLDELREESEDRRMAGTGNGVINRCVPFLPFGREDWRAYGAVRGRIRRTRKLGYWNRSLFISRHLSKRIQLNSNEKYVIFSPVESRDRTSYYVISVPKNSRLVSSLSPITLESLQTRSALHCHKMNEFPPLPPLARNPKRSIFPACLQRSTPPSTSPCTKHFVRREQR